MTVTTLRAPPPLITGQPRTASSGRANEVDARGGRTGRKLADLLKAPGVPAGGVLGQAGRRASGDTPTPGVAAHAADSQNARRCFAA